MRTVIGLVAIALLAPATALAQGAPETARTRGGLALEGELGLGGLNSQNPSDVDLSSFGATATGRLGGYLTPRMMLMVMAGVTSGDFEDPDFVGPGGTLAELFLGASFRYWVSEKFWAEANLSSSRLVIERLGRVDEQVFAGTRLGLTGGFVIYDGQRLNLDGRLGFAFGGYGNDVRSSSLWVSIGLTTK